VVPHSDRPCLPRLGRLRQSCKSSRWTSHLRASGLPRIRAGVITLLLSSDPQKSNEKTSGVATPTSMALLFASVRGFVRRSKCRLPLDNIVFGFDLLRGITVEQAKKIADTLNENVLSIFVTLSDAHPMFEPKK
jgi:hypothetical protein